MKGDNSKAILHQLETFRQMGSVLYIAAHPDDENTELLAYLARGRKYRTAYLSLTRGDGGQNVLGADLDAKLGVARTQELLAARKIDGAQQFFTRAIDFGFSKNYQETLNVWNKQEVLSDVVRVIRQFRPDVIITRFSPTPGGTHGHHTTSALLALEAFKLAGDAASFPEQKLPPWQAKRIFWNVSTFQKEKIDAKTPVLKIDGSGKDSVTGETYREIASASRAMHKTQGFDSFRLPDGNGEQSFQLLDGANATKDILEGVDTSWNRIDGGAQIESSIDKIIGRFNANDPAASVSSLLELRKQLAALPNKDAIVQEKQVLLDRILQECLGLTIETTVSHSDAVPGEHLNLHTTARISRVPENIKVRWLSLHYPTLKKDVDRGVDLRSNESTTFDSTETLPVSAILTQPYWLRKENTTGMSQVDDSNLIGTAENSPPFPIEGVFEIDGQKIVIHDEPIQIVSGANGDSLRRRLDVIPPVSLRFSSDVVVLTPSTSRTVEVELKSARTNSAGTLQLETPKGWKVQPAKQSFNLPTSGQTAKLSFTITAPAKAETAKIVACANLQGLKYRSQRQEVDYKHIPRQLIQSPAVVKAVCLNLATKSHTIGYLPGAGDSLVENMQQMGYAVKVLDDANLTSKDLQELDAVVLGVRAFNVRTNIQAALPVLFSYVENGGTVIVQYNRPDKLKADKVAPFDLRISADRVTDEKAKMTFVAPNNPILNTPNKITAADFDGWVQERGLYFPNKWDEHFEPILSCNDPGEQPTKGVLLVAQYGKGHYVYTGLSFFRQLPAGVAGAYRLFANMVSIGK